MATQYENRFTLYSSSDYHFEVIDFELVENLSEPFKLTVNTSCNDPEIDTGQLLDQAVTFTFWQHDQVKRRVNGIVSRIKQSDPGFRRTHYQLTIEPELFRTRLRSNCRIFQDKDIQTIITELLTENGCQHVRFDTHDSRIAREYCVQYRETDLEFIERLAAEEGLVYHFEHSKDQHHLIFSDHLHHNASDIDVIYNSTPAAQQPEPALRVFDYAETLNTDEHQMRDYTFKHPRYSLEHTQRGDNRFTAGQLNRIPYQKFDYPGRYKEDAQGSPFNRYRLEFERRDSQRVFGEGDDMRLEAGKIIDLTDHAKKELVGNWLITAITHRGKQPQSQHEDACNTQGEQGSRYSSTLSLVPHGQAWRAQPQPKPSVDGIQIAHVVGPAGEEIYCDDYGRVKVQFPWDRYGSMDEHSSCWIRVSQDWGGAAWGHMAIPRIGHEVIVDFLEGDPDQPIITGRTYHANNRPPYALPEHKTMTTIKSQTHKGIGFNELRFEDEAGQEEIYIHAQKDQNNVVQNDETTNVGHDRTENIGRDETINIGHDRTEEVTNDETLSVTRDQRETIGRDRFQVIERNRITRIDKDFVEKVNNHRIESTHANHHEEVGGHYTHTVNGNYSLEVVDSITSQTTRHLSTASEKMTIQGPGGSITIDSGGLTIQAKHIHIEAGSVAFNGPASGSVGSVNYEVNTGKELDEIVPGKKITYAAQAPWAAPEIPDTTDAKETPYNPSIATLSWTEDRVKIGEPAELTFTTKQFKGGETVTIDVYEYDNGSKKTKVDTLTTVIKNPEKESHALNWTRTKQQVNQDLEKDAEEGDKGPLEYRFDVTAGGIKSTTSGPLNITKTVRLVQSDEKSKHIQQDLDVILTTADGKTMRQTYQYGQAVFEDVLIGPIHLEVEPTKQEEGKNND